jgi:KDO2-lipid IV(A) lauroyltransferase
MIADVRDGRRWSRAQSVKNDVLYALAITALALVRPLPAAALRTLGRALGIAAYALFGDARRIARANLARAFPSLDDRARGALLRRTYLSLGTSLGDTLAMLGGSSTIGAHAHALSLDDASRETLREAHGEGRGVVFASAHLGPWEAVAAALVAAGVPLTTLARESYDPRFTRLYDRLRSAHGVRAIYRGTPGAAARIVRTLRRNAVLGVPMDLRSRVPSIAVPFLGAPALTAIGPARIALRTRAAVVVGTAAPLGHGARIGVTVTRIPSGDLRADDAGALALTTRINAEISRRILAMPDAWPWMHDRFGSASESASKRASNPHTRGSPDFFARGR